MTSVKHNGQHIGNVAKNNDGTWKAWSAVRTAYVDGQAQTFTAKTKTACVDWLEIVAEHAAEGK